MAVDVNNRPSLEELLITTSNAVLTKDAAWYAITDWPTKVYETDGAIHGIIERCILDADINVNP